MPAGPTAIDYPRGPDPRTVFSPSPADATVPLLRAGVGPNGMPPGHPAPHAQPQGRSISPPGAPAARSMSPPGAPAARSISPRSAPAAPGAGRRLDMRPIPPSLDRLMGRTLNGRYLVERKIGEGGFGAVFRGRQVATGREVALKILHPHNLGDATVVARFRREAEACSKLTNPHTVTIYDFDETEDGTLYLAMELLRGRPLQEVERADSPLEPRRVLQILDQVAEALGEAHGLGIVHRDMKPENIMVEVREGQDYVKVLDFGIAKLGDNGAGKAVPALTAVGQTLGTLEFMSPEQLRGRPLDGRSDIYALGIVAYEMLTGLLPWREARVPIDVIKFHLETPPPLPSHLRRDLPIPKEVDEIVLRMCAKDPADRYADAADLRVHLEQAIAALDRRNGRGKTVRVLGVAAGIVLVLAAAGLVLFR
jgi:serine/threonine-protein kinase